MLCLVAQSCPALWDPTDCSPPGSSVHGDSPGKNTGVGCHAFLQGIFPTQGSNPGLLHCRRIFLPPELPKNIQKYSRIFRNIQGIFTDLPVNIQGWFPLELTDLVSSLSKGLSRVFFSTIVWKHQVFSTQPSFVVVVVVFVQNLNTILMVN